MTSSATRWWSGRAASACAQPRSGCGPGWRDGVWPRRLGTPLTGSTCWPTGGCSATGARSQERRPAAARARGRRRRGSDLRRADLGLVLPRSTRTTPERARLTLDPPPTGKQPDRRLGPAVARQGRAAAARIPNLHRLHLDACLDENSRAEHGCWCGPGPTTSRRPSGCSSTPLGLFDATYDVAMLRAIARLAEGSTP